MNELRSYSFKEISVARLPDAVVRAHGNRTKLVRHWQADCGDDHARGETPGIAVANLVEYVIEKREAENARNRENR